MEEIKETIKSVMHGLDTRKRKSAKDGTQALLKKVFSKKELRHIKFHYLKRGTLSINVDSSSWLYYLSLRKEDLLNKLRQEPRTIKNIRFFLGQIKPRLTERSKRKSVG